MTDTDGRRVVPINSTRWPEEDLQRGTLEIFFQGWKERLRSTAGSPPPGLHPLLSFHGPGLSTPPASRPPSRPPSPLPLQRRAVIIFSGAPDKPFSLSQSLRELGWLVQDFDLLEGKDDHNVLLKEPSDAIARAAAEAHFVWMAPPCNPYSVAADHRPQLFSVKSQWWLWMAQESEGAETGRLHPAWAAYARQAWAISRDQPLRRSRYTRLPRQARLLVRRKPAAARPAGSARLLGGIRRLRDALARAQC
jgi:hypothetical protein